MIGKHSVSVRLTVDLIPEIEIIVHREGESPESALEEEEKATIQAEEALAEILEEDDFDQEFEIDDIAGESEQAAEIDLSDEDGEAEGEEDEAD